MKDENKSTSHAVDASIVESVGDLVLVARGAAGVCLVMAEYLAAAQPLLSETLSMLYVVLEAASEEAEEALTSASDI